MFTVEFFFFFCPDGIPPNFGLTGPNNTYIYVCIYMRTQMISILKKMWAFMKKESARKVVIFVPVFLNSSINQRFRDSFLKFRDTSQKTIYDLPRKIWRIKNQINSSNLFRLNIWKILFFNSLESIINQQFKKNLISSQTQFNKWAKKYLFRKYSIIT